MKKEEILEASRKENKNKDFAEMETTRTAGNYSAAVGTIACLIISILASHLAHTILYSPWAIYFSIVGTNWLVRALKGKKKSNFAIGIMFILLAVLAFVGLVMRLTEVAV